MHNLLRWFGILLILLALLSAFSIALIPGLSFAGPLPVLMGIAGTYLWIKPHR